MPQEAIDYSIATPVWKQLASIIRGRILAGRYQPGHAIPSENQTEQEFGVSRGTCRKAHMQLRADGLIVTVTGRGSYVVSEEELRRYRREHE